MIRRMSWIGGVVCAVSAGAFAAVVEQGLTVRGRAEEWVVPTCAYVTVYAEERSPQADIAYRTVEKLSERIIKSAKDASKDVTDVLVRNETIKVKTEILNTANVDNSEYYVRQRLRFVCEPSMELAADVIYAACQSKAVLCGTSSTVGTINVYPVSETELTRTVYFGVERDDKLARRMTEKALADAAERAKILSELSGKKIGKIISVECDEFINGEVPASDALEAGFPVGIIGVGSDKIFVSYDVVVTYEFTE